MTTTVTSILRDGVTASGVYPTLAAWKAALPASLVSADEIHILNVEAKSGGYTGISLDTTGITTDATHYIKIQAASGHRHAGVWDTSKALFIASGTQPFAIKTNYIYFDGIQFEHSGITTQSYTFKLDGHTTTDNKTTVTGCLFKIQSSGDTGLCNCFHVDEGSAGRSNLYLGSNIFIEVKNSTYPTTTGMAAIRLNYGHVYAYNNTFGDVSNAFWGGDATYQFLLKNNLSAGTQFNSGRTDFGMAAAAVATGSTNNASHDGTAPGASAKTSQTFVFAGTGNYHLDTSDTAAKDAGADLSSDSAFTLTTDIDGNSYSTPWPIGADIIAGASNTVAISTPLTGRIFQSLSGVANIAVTGTYTGTVTSLKARVVQFGTSTAVSGFDWATVVASPTGGTYSFTLTSVPKGTGWYSIQVQDTVDSGITVTGPKVGVGELICVAGQSNAGAFFYPYAASVSDLVRAYGYNFTNWESPTGGGPEALGNALVSYYNCPVGLIDDHLDGTPISSWVGAGVPVNTAAVGGKLGGIVWIQGEADWNGTSYADYLSRLTSVISGFRTDLGQSSLPIVIVALGSYPDTTGSDATTYNEVKRAQYAYAAGASNTYIVDRIDATTGGLHLDSAGAGVVGARSAQAFKVALGQASQYRGPSISSVIRVNATTYNVNLTHRLGSDITPATQITGFIAKDPGAGNAVISITSALRQSATMVQLVLASSPVSLPSISYATGPVPVITAMVRDNSALTLPVEFNEGVTATEKLASVTLVNSSNSPQASLTGLKWAWFDQTTPDTFVAPTDKGTGEVTDGSGVLSVSIGNSVKTSGQVGWLVVTNSDGTTTQSPSAKVFSGPVAVT